MAVKSESDFQILVKIGGDFHYFTEFSGGEQEHDTETYPLADRYGKGYIKGMPSVTEITVRRPYDNRIDDPFAKKLQKLCGEQILVEITPMAVCPEYQSDGDPTVYTQLSVSKIGRPQANRGNSGTMMVEYSFTVGTMEIGGRTTEVVGAAV